MWVNCAKTFAPSESLDRNSILFLPHARLSRRLGQDSDPGRAFSAEGTARLPSLSVLPSNASSEGDKATYVFAASRGNHRPL